MRNRALVALLVLGLFLGVSIPTFSLASSAWQDEKLRLDKPAPVVRKRRGRRKAYVEQAPLLRIQWSVLKRDEDELPRETSTDAIFHDGDRLQLRIKANQRGHLHIFQNTDGEDGEQVFPDSSIRHGSSLVNDFEEIVIPSECERKFRDENGNCWFRVSDPPGLEIYTVILSREASPDALKGINVPAGKIRLPDLARIKETPTTMTSRKVLDPESSGRSGLHAITVINKDKRNNEELIVRIRLNHRGKE